MAGREAIINNFDPFRLAQAKLEPVGAFLLVNFTENDQISGDEIYLKRLKPNSLTDSAMVIATTRFIITAFNFR